MSDPSPKPPHDPQDSIFDMGISQQPVGKNTRRKRWMASGPPAKLILFSMAALGGIVIILALKQPSPAPPPAPVAAPPVAQIPAPAPAAPARPDIDLPPLGPRTVIGLPNQSSYELPIYTGTAAMDWVAKTLQIRNVLPPKELVRTEDMLNYFALRPTGPTAVSRGITLSTESIACPWRPSATLFLISIRAAKTGDHSVSATLKPAMVNVARYKVLGFETTTDPGFTPAKSVTLRAGEIATLALEIEPSIAASELGSIVWSVDNQPAPPVPLSRRTDVEPSDDARFAVLVCAYSQWLAYERPELIDVHLVAALARELAASNLPADRAALLSLIDRSMNF